MIQVNVHEAKSQLSRLVRAVESGEQVVIARHGVPVAELIPHKAQTGRRTGGLWAGKAWISPDFDGPMPEVEELFGT